MSQPLTETTPHIQAIKVQEALTEALSLIRYGISEPSLEPSQEELALLRALRDAEKGMQHTLRGIRSHTHQEPARPLFEQLQDEPKSDTFDLNQFLGR